MTTGAAAERKRTVQEPGVEMPAPQVRERRTDGAAGLPVAGLILLSALGGSGSGIGVWGVLRLAGGSVPSGGVVVIVGLLLVLAGLGAAAGLSMVAPGEARVVQLFGRYAGTIRTDGLRWVNPLTQRRKVSTRIRNHETGVAKVNDADGNPIEIAAVVVWQVADTAQAVFEVSARPPW